MLLGGIYNHVFRLLINFCVCNSLIYNLGLFSVLFTTIALHVLRSFCVLARPFDLRMGKGYI